MVQDKSGRGNDGRLNGTLVTGATGYAVRDSGGYGGAVSVTNSPSLSLASGDYSFEVSIKPHGVPPGGSSAWRWIFYKAMPYGGLMDYGLYLAGSPANKVCMTTAPNTAGFCANYTFANETWVHVALTNEAGVWRLYVNGVLQGSQTGHANDLDSTSADLLVGLSSYTDLDNVQIWARARTHAEICADANKNWNGFACY